MMVQSKKVIDKNNLIILTETQHGIKIKDGKSASLNNIQHHPSQKFDQCYVNADKHFITVIENYLKKSFSINYKMRDPSISTIK